MRRVRFLADMRLAGAAGLLVLAGVVSGAAAPTAGQAEAGGPVVVTDAADPASDADDTAPQMPTFPEAFAGLPEAVINEHLMGAACEDLASDHMRDRPPIVGKVSEVATVYAIPCVAGATETLYRVYLHETGEIGGVHPVYFAIWTPDHAWIGTDLLKAVRFDPATGQLSGESAGTAGAGRSSTCRVRGLWTWNRWAFGLTRMESVGCPAAVPAVVYP